MKPQYISTKRDSKRKNPEYDVYKAAATYLKLQYPKALYRFDMAGLNLSIAQAGQNKAIQCTRGWPDFFVCEERHAFKGLLLEIKPAGARIRKLNGSFASDHLEEQNACLIAFLQRGYYAEFCIGFDRFKEIIDWYMNPNAPKISNGTTIHK